MSVPILQFKRGNFSDLNFGLRAGEPALTLDTFDLFVGLTSTFGDNKFFGSDRYWEREDETTSLRLRLVDKTGNVQNSIHLKSPDSHTGVTTYTFPSAPSSGRVLTTNEFGDLSWSNALGITTLTNSVDFTSNTQSVDKDSGAVVITNGGLGVEGNVNLGGNLGVTGIASIGNNLTVQNNLYVGGTSEFVGVVTFRGGTINIGDGDTDNINVGGEFTSSLVPNTDNTHDLGSPSQRWRTVYAVNLTSNNTQFAGITTFNGLIDANAGLDVSGQTTLNNSLSVSGISTLNTLEVLENTTLGNGAGDLLTVNATATFLSTLTGTISTATRATTVDTTETSTNAEFYPTFVSASASTESQTVRTDSGISYNPDDNALTVPNIKTQNIKHSNGTQSVTIDSSGNVGLSSNLTVTGNLFVNGSTTSVNTNTLSVKDSLIDLGLVDNGSGTLIPPTVDLNIDVGVLLNYYDGQARKAALYWDDSVSRIAIASSISETNSVITANAYAALEVGGLWINNTCTGNAPTEVISCFSGSELEIRNVLIDAGTF